MCLRGRPPTTCRYQFLAANNDSMSSRFMLLIRVGITRRVAGQLAGFGCVVVAFLASSQLSANLFPHGRLRLDGQTWFLSEVKKILNTCTVCLSEAGIFIRLQYRG
ncbi:hypothetical protein K461DRAFT_137421 [Myriangium duriaei CBS 260.36]|uniref:Uncharacterized protein n=1 Tax=Myriangium duriaei CBS 260.36 TaxID=1168546 RepID=A0A9P4J6C5_9PEZI|nr:hypothetical protein K461DRAFT_137421 [Myriangium duriaei CBS 260.36]